MKNVGFTQCFGNFFKKRIIQINWIKRFVYNQTLFFKNSVQFIYLNILNKFTYFRNKIFDFHNIHSLFVEEIASFNRVLNIVVGKNCALTVIFIHRKNNQITVTLSKHYVLFWTHFVFNTLEHFWE